MLGGKMMANHANRNNMNSTSRESALTCILDLADERGFVLMDDIINECDRCNLEITDVDWLSNEISIRGIIQYDSIPVSKSEVEQSQFFDYAQVDYEEVYKRVIEMDVGLRFFVDYVKKIQPPQKKEARLLKAQISEGNSYARKRLIEMYLRVAVKIALQRAEKYDWEISDAISVACMGLIAAVEKYDADTSGPFLSYASFWIYQYLGREQPVTRCTAYYPVHIKEKCFSIYEPLKKYGCIQCEMLRTCKKARKIVAKNLDMSNDDASIEEIVSSLIPDDLFDELPEDFPIRDDDGHIIYSHDIEDVFSRDCTNQIRLLLKTLSPKEEEVLTRRFGIDGSRPQTLEEISVSFGVTRERIRQIESKAIRRLRHPSRINMIRDYLDLEF